MIPAQSNAGWIVCIGVVAAQPVTTNAVESASQGSGRAGSGLNRMIILLMHGDIERRALGARLSDGRGGLGGGPLPAGDDGGHMGGDGSGLGPGQLGLKVVDIEGAGHCGGDGARADPQARIYQPGEQPGGYGHGVSLS